MERIKSILVRPDISIKEALKRMDATAKKILFVVENHDEISGVISDGDIRRWILKGNNLDAKVTRIMNKKPVLIKEGFTREEAERLMLSRKIECIPVVDGNKKLVSAVWWVDLFEDKLKKKASINAPVVVMAGGEGRRLSPFTNILPKPLIPVGDKPILELIMEKFSECGCGDFYLSVNYKADILKAYFNESSRHYRIKYIHEGKPLGTAGSLYLLKDIVKSDFFVSNCDTLIDADYCDIMKSHKKNKNAITLVVSLKHLVIPYGICEVEDGGKLKEIKEKPEYDFLVNTGLYIVAHQVLGYVPVNKFYNMTDLINDCLKKNRKIGFYPVFERAWFDMGQLHELRDNLRYFKK